MYRVYVAESDTEVPIGTVELKLNFIRTGEDKADVILFINGKETGNTKIERFIYTSSEIITLKANKHISVYDEDYAAPFMYPAEIDRIVFETAAVDMNHEEEIKKVMHVE